MSFFKRIVMVGQQFQHMLNGNSWRHILSTSLSNNTTAEQAIAETLMLEHGEKHSDSSSVILATRKRAHQQLIEAENLAAYGNFPYAGDKLEFTDKFKVMRILCHYIDALNAADEKFQGYDIKERVLIKHKDFFHKNKKATVFRALSLSMTQAYIEMIQEDPILTTAALHLQSFSATSMSGNKDKYYQEQIVSFLSKYEQACKTLALQNNSSQARVVASTAMQAPESIKISPDYRTRRLFKEAGEHLNKLPKHLLLQNINLKQAAIVTSYHCVDIWHRDFGPTDLSREDPQTKAIYYFWLLTELAPDSPEAQYLHNGYLYGIDGLFSSLLEAYPDFFPTLKQEIDDIIGFLRCMLAANWSLREGDPKEASTAYDYADGYLAKISPKIIKSDEVLLSLTGELLYGLAKKNEFCDNDNHQNFGCSSFDDYKRRFFELVDPEDPHCILRPLVGAFAHLPLSNQRVQICRDSYISTGIWPPFAEPLPCQRVELSEEGSPECVASPAIEPIRVSACQSALFDSPKATASSKELSAQRLGSKDTVEPVVPRLPR